MRRRLMHGALAAILLLALLPGCARLHRLRADVLVPLCTAYQVGHAWYLRAAPYLDGLAAINPTVAARWYQIRAGIELANATITVVCAMGEAEETRARVALATGAELVAQAATLYGEVVPAPVAALDSGRPEWEITLEQMRALQERLITE
jgi:hypothetical protein